LRSFLRTVFTPVPTRHTRAPRFLAFTAVALLTVSAILAFGIWMAVMPPPQPQVRTHNTRFPGIFTLVAAVAIAVQLIWTATKGYVYCGHFEVVRKVDDRLIYRTYCLIHFVIVAVFALLAFEFLWRLPT
jgi:hypothetical protein